MIISKRKISEVELVIFLFCFIFAPPIVPIINLIFLVFAYAAFQLFRAKSSVVIEIFDKSEIKKYCIWMYVAFTYIVLTMAVGLMFEYVGISNYIKTLYRFGLLIPITVTCIIYIIFMAKRLNYDFYDLLHAVVKAGMIQAIISILMFLVPGIKQFIVDIMFANTGSDLMQNAWVYQRRLYGFSNSVLDSFGYGTGILASIPLFLAFKKNMKYLLYIPFLIVVPFLNSRTGLIVFSMALVVVLPLYVFNIKKLWKVVTLFIVNIILVIEAYKVLEKLNPTTFVWVENGIANLLSVFNISTSLGSVEAESTSKLFSGSFWRIPDSIFSLIFGAGHNVYEAIGYFHSDVGYINDLWLGGIVGIILFYMPLLMLLLKNAIKLKENILRSMLIFLCVAFLVVNIKGYMINYNSGMALTLLIAFSIVYFNKKAINKGRATK